MDGETPFLKISMRGLVWFETRIRDLSFGDRGILASSLKFKEVREPAYL